MRKSWIYTVIALIAVVAILFAVLCDSHYKNFKIIGASMKLIEVPDSAISGKHYLLITFSSEYCNPEYGFWKGSIEPGINGIDEDVESIQLLDSCGNEISLAVKGWDCDDEFEGGYYSDRSMAQLQASLNARKDVKSIGVHIEQPRLYYVSSLDSIPQELVISFKSRQVKSRLEH